MININDRVAKSSETGTIFGTVRAKIGIALVIAWDILPKLTVETAADVELA